MWNAVKVVFRGKFITLNVCIRKEGKSEINDLTFHLKKKARKRRVNSKMTEQIKPKRMK